MSAFLDYAFLSKQKGTPAFQYFFFAFLFAFLNRKNDRIPKTKGLLYTVQSLLVTFARPPPGGKKMVLSEEPIYGLVMTIFRVQPYMDRLEWGVP